LEPEKIMRIAIAGGGTGGHLFPGIAIAEEFIKRDAATEVIFIGTQKGIESRLLDSRGYVLKTIDIEGVTGRGIRGLMKGAFQIPKSMWQSRKILKHFSPDMVFGVGGYASGPAVLAARLMNIPTAIAEQNAIPGMTNKILGHFVDRIFVTYEQTRAAFPPRKVIVSGNPVRASFTAQRFRTKKEKNCRQLLIFGGSQGAEAINRSVIEMLPQLKGRKEKICVMHQTGVRQLEEVKKVYEHFGIEAEVTSFIVDMAQAYADAELIICRAGATSLAEITAAGKAAILIPYPWAANDHQLKNAQAMKAEGAAEIIEEKELSGSRLFGVVESLLGDASKLRKMEMNASRISKTGAAATIVDECMKLITEQNRYH
jgi:UDP-N-acetylglucosamine--N-acetylmuramyl-(pentapeptide) pyrophosphoryl-undecaprenol N-acetylglucosamine transferase